MTDRRASHLAVEDHMRRSYIRVLIVWGLTLAGLYAFQAWFS
jgi:hypothetical protein